MQPGQPYYGPFPVVAQPAVGQEGHGQEVGPLAPPEGQPGPEAANMDLPSDERPAHGAAEVPERPPEMTVTMPPDTEAIEAAFAMEEKDQGEGLPGAGTLPPPTLSGRKVMVGALSVILVFLALFTGGLFRATGPACKEAVLVPLIRDATLVPERFDEDYSNLLSAARTHPDATLVVNGTGITVALPAAKVKELTRAKLELLAIENAAEHLYSKGYSGNAAMDMADGWKEARAKAVDELILGTCNEGFHGSVIWWFVPILLLAVCAIAFLVFLCEGWAKLIGMGTVFLIVSVPASAGIRLVDLLFWGGEKAGPYTGAMYQSLSSLSSSGLLFFDLTLLLGLALVVGGMSGRRAHTLAAERLNPFRELSEPESFLGVPSIEEIERAGEGEEEQNTGGVDDAE